MTENSLRDKLLAMQKNPESAETIDPTTLPTAAEAEVAGKNILPPIKNDSTNAAPAEPEADPGQCQCGSALAGECSECDEKPDPPILDRLRALGDQRAVNPPEGPEKAAEEPPPAAETPEPGDDGKTPCPYCSKRFKHLSRHKCKEVPQEAAEAPPAEPPAETPVEAPAATGDDVVAPQPGPRDDSLAAEVARLEKVAHDMNAITIKQREELEELKRQLAEPKTFEDVLLAETGEALKEEIATLKKQLEAALEGVSTAPTRDGYVLLLDCLAHRELEGPTVDFAELIAPMAKRVAEENKAIHWRAIEFNPGPGMLAAVLDHYLINNMPSGFLRASSSDLETNACLSVLKKHALNVIQGVR